MLARICHRREPVERLRIQIGIAHEGPAIEEIVAQIADGAFYFPLGLRAIGPTDLHAATPVLGKAEELEIVHEPSARQTIIAREHRAHLVE